MPKEHASSHRTCGRCFERKVLSLAGSATYHWSSSVSLQQRIFKLFKINIYLLTTMIPLRWNQIHFACLYCIDISSGVYWGNQCLFTGLTMCIDRHKEFDIKLAAIMSLKIVQFFWETSVKIIMLHSIMNSVQWNILENCLVSVAYRHRI